MSIEFSMSSIILAKIREHYNIQPNDEISDFFVKDYIFNVLNNATRKYDEQENSS